MVQRIFNYGRENFDFGTPTGLAAAVIAGGSAQTDTYTFGGSFVYRINTAYLKGGAALDFGHGSETETVDGSTGSFNTRGYLTGLSIGNVFMLLNTISSGNSSGMPTKAPPKPAGGYSVGLDVSGYLAYSNEQIDGFTDSSGFIYGTDQTRYGDIGGRARLFAIVPNNGLLWMPYVACTVDQEFGFSSTLNIPIQAAVPGGDLVGLQTAQTFGGAQLGLDVRGPSGLTVGVKGFYSASADTNTTGGNIYLKIPFNYTPTVASRY